MVKKRKKVLVSGFNARPLSKSLYNANYEVYTVDFFGDSDLYPYVRDCLVISNELKSNFQKLKLGYSDVLANLTIQMIEKYSDLDYLIIGSGLDDNIIGRKKINKKIEKIGHQIKYLGNIVNQIIKSRDILSIYSLLKQIGYTVPKTLTLNYDLLDNNQINYPIILKKKQSSGGINVFKINSKIELLDLIERNEEIEKNFENWFLQEYINGLDVSCTTISNNVDAKIVSVNEQLIGKKFLNAPSEFIYCGNIVPANFDQTLSQKISEISLILVKHLSLIGINGFDFVLKDGYPYLMEINPRIPGSINAAEVSLNRNLLNEHIICCLNPEKIIDIPHIDVKTNFVSKFIYFSPKLISHQKIERLRQIKYIEDIPARGRNVQQLEPLCSVLFKANSYSRAFNGALGIIENIEMIIN